MTTYRLVMKGKRVGNMIVHQYESGAVELIALGNSVWLNSKEAIKLGRFLSPSPTGQKSNKQSRIKK